MRSRRRPRVRGLAVRVAWRRLAFTIATALPSAPSLLHQRRGEPLVRHGVESNQKNRTKRVEPKELIQAKGSMEPKEEVGHHYRVSMGGDSVATHQIDFSTKDEPWWADGSPKASRSAPQLHAQSEPSAVARPPTVEHLRGPRARGRRALLSSLPLPRRVAAHTARARRRRAAAFSFISCAEMDS